MQRIAFIISLVTLVSMAVWPISCSVDTSASSGVPAELEEFVAQAIIDETLDKAGEKPNVAEGAVVAHVVAMEGRNENLSPIRVWTYNEGQLLETDPVIFKKAISTNSSEWPHLTFAFAFESVMGKRENVIIRTLYDTSKIETGRGGNEQSWEIKEMTSGWQVGNKNVLMSWD